MADRASCWGWPAISASGGPAHALDKVKQTASQVAADAKKAGAQIQSKVEQSQLRKKADENAKQLGYLVVRERTEGTAAGEEGDRLVAEIVDLEREIAEEVARKAEAGDGGPAEPDASTQADTPEAG